MVPYVPASRVILGVQQRVVEGLHDEEGDAEEHRHRQVAQEPRPVAPPDRPHGELRRERAQDQEDRRRQHERQELQEVRLVRFGVERRPHATRGVRSRGEVGGEQPGEEHDLAGEEEQHPEHRVADPAASWGSPAIGLCSVVVRAWVSVVIVVFRSVADAPVTGVEQRSLGADLREPVEVVGGGGELVAHSSVFASHGSSPAGSPLRSDRKMFVRNGIMLDAIRNPPTVAATLRSCQPDAAE